MMEAELHPQQRLLLERAARIVPTAPRPDIPRGLDGEPVAPLFQIGALGWVYTRPGKPSWARLTGVQYSAASGGWHYLWQAEPLW